MARNVNFSNFESVAPVIIDSIYSALSRNSGYPISFEEGPDEDSGLIGRCLYRLTTVNAEFWVLLRKDSVYPYLAVAKICPINEGYKQDLSEINKANDELAGIKVTMDEECDSVMLSVEINLEEMIDFRWGSAVITSITQILQACELLKKKKIIKGLSNFLNVLK